MTPPAGGFLAPSYHKGTPLPSSIEKNFVTHTAKIIELCRSVTPHRGNRRQGKPPAGETLSSGMYKDILSIRRRQ